jgi:hypothetical protein
MEMTSPKASTPAALRAEGVPVRRHGRRRVLQQFQTRLTRRQALGGDTGTDDHRSQERAAGEFRGHPTPQRTGALVTAPVLTELSWLASQVIEPAGHCAAE